MIGVGVMWLFKQCHEPLPPNPQIRQINQNLPETLENSANKIDLKKIEEINRLSQPTKMHSIGPIRVIPKPAGGSMHW